MSRLIKETLKIAKKRFEAFGFSPSQIERLLSSAEEDLGKVVAELQQLIDDQSSSTKQLELTLHALKGILYNMGNIEAGDLMVELKNLQDKERVRQKIKEVLGD